MVLFKGGVPVGTCKHKAVSPKSLPLLIYSLLK